MGLPDLIATSSKVLISARRIGDAAARPARAVARKCLVCIICSIQGNETGSMDLKGGDRVRYEMK